ncbi:MAG: hypothetical protein RJA52_1171 [Bacteroidota bacterium]|jgi:DNA repair protein RadC
MKDYNKIYQPIRHWAEDDRPREKFLQKGRHNLSNAELLAILLSSGSKDESAVDLARRILYTVNENLLELGKMTVGQLTQFKGIGAVKAITILAAIELGRRRLEIVPGIKEQILSSKKAYELMRSKLEDIPHEEFWVFFLNRSNYILQKVKISSGGLSATIVDPKIIFRKAIEANASGIVLYHNHPSGNLDPSPADIDLTNKMVSGAKHFDINIIDHIIISEKGYYSFSDQGKI